MLFVFMTMAVEIANYVAVNGITAQTVRVLVR